jgi:hypothetical protein
MRIMRVISYHTFYWTVLLFCAATVTLSCTAVRAEHDGSVGWVVTQMASGLSFNSTNGLFKRKSIEKEALISASSVGEHALLRFWEPAAFRPTTMLENNKLVDGYNIDDVSRVRSVRIDKSGSLAYLRSQKGPRTTVDLIQDGEVIFQWPRLTRASLVSFDSKGLIVSVQDKDSLRYVFWRMPRDADGQLNADKRISLGHLDHCALLSAKSLKDGIVLQVFCDQRKGSDVYFLATDAHEPVPIANSDKDEILAYGLDRSIREDIPVLAIAGSRSGRQAFHGISGLLLSGLGEPGSIASDEAGYQSWNQSYRTMALSVLYKKTGHEVFAALAKRAMQGTLNTTNSKLGIGGTHNPSCGWASRIYSEDHKTPVSLMVNQAMIVGSLIRSCRILGDACPVTLRQEIETTAVCAVEAQEKNFDTKSELYRIPYGINFRYDGIWAPWNWQMAWAFVLREAAQVADNQEWDRRSASLVHRFLDTWEFTEDGALWRYWPPEYSAGWTDIDRVSVSKPSQKRARNTNYEDIAHAGISLLALGEMPMEEKRTKTIQARLDILLDKGFMLPRFIDGGGVASPRWFPGAGWDVFTTDAHQKRYEKLIPGAASGDRLLAYSNLYDPDGRFELDLELLSCSVSGCSKAGAWQFGSVEAYLDRSPLFSIERDD